MLISIIIPVYNTEKYLDECIQSILSQTYTDFELILINDGSTDNSLSICKKYANQDQRIVLIDKANGGVSSARNAGINIAKGEWVTFVDSDDYISQNYFDVQALNETFDFILLEVKTSNIDSTLEVENLTFPKFFEKFKLYHDFSGPCGKFYKYKIIHNYKLRFDEKISFGEDALFNLEYLYRCEFLKITVNNYYVYRDVYNSLTKKNISLETYTYLFNRLVDVSKLYIDRGVNIERNLDFILQRYFFAIAKSNLIYIEKEKLLLYLIRKYRTILITALEKDYIYKVKITNFLRLKLDFILVKLLIQKK